MPIYYRLLVINYGSYLCESIFVGKRHLVMLLETICIIRPFSYIVSFDLFYFLLQPKVGFICSF